MALEASDILDPVAVTLFDVDHVTWTADDLLRALNEAQRHLVTLRPEANTLTVVQALTEGVNQALPAGGRALVDIPRNYVATPYQWLLHSHYSVTDAPMSWPTETTVRVPVDFGTLSIDQSNRDSLGQTPTTLAVSVQLDAPAGSGYQIQIQIYTNYGAMVGSGYLDVTPGATAGTLAVAIGAMGPTEYIASFAFYRPFNMFAFTVTAIAATPVQYGGVTPGPAITLCEREILTAYAPDWPTHTPSATVENFCYDERSPLVFQVYPPADTAARVELIYVADPVACEFNDSSLGVPDAYAEPLRYLTLAICYEQDIEGGANRAKAMDARAFAVQLLGAAEAKGLTKSPNTVDPGGYPSRQLSVAGGA
jgi:hypothetical protein